METTPVPDIAGRDLTTSPTERAAALAAQLEAENTERLKKLSGLGINPSQFAGAALQLRLEALIDTLPDAHRAVVEVSYETGMAQLLDEAIASVGKPKLFTPGG